MKEAYKEIKALLEMLTHLGTGSFADLNDKPSGSSPPLQDGAADVASVVFIGLQTLIPFLTSELLAFLKLCRQYFALLSFLFEVYPAKVAALHPSLFVTLVSEERKRVCSAFVFVCCAHHDTTLCFLIRHLRRFERSSMG